VRGEEVIRKIIRGANVAENRVLLEDLCETMIDGSLCAMGGMTPFPVLSALQFWPEDFGLSPVRKAA
jgi:formate dehydrogenase iron-sulfur subunit